MSEEHTVAWVRPPPGGVDFTVPGVDDLPDLHGDLPAADLVVFFGGNQFMVLPELMAAFRRRQPEYQRVFYETLPPGIVQRQLETGSLVIGNLRISARADVFVAGVRRASELSRRGLLEQPIPYFCNRLAIMVHAGNPRRIASLADLAAREVRLSMPNPETEGIGNLIAEALRRAGGDGLARAVLEEKVAAGATFVTRIHHRQTPLRILTGRSDAGVVWRTEALFQQRIGNPIGMVEIPDPYNVESTTAVAVVTRAEHPGAARAFVDFLQTETAAAIYRDYGFVPAAGDLGPYGTAEHSS